MQWENTICNVGSTKTLRCERMVLTESSLVKFDGSLGSAHFGSRYAVVHTVSMWL